MPTLVIEDERAQVDPLLLEVRRALWRHPLAAQSLFRMLVAEGRRFAATAEGREWAERLAHAERLEQVAVVWDLVTSRALEDDPATVVPSVVAEAFVKAATERSLAQLITLVTTARAAPSSDASS
jgi:hypothetical protein